MPIYYGTTAKGEIWEGWANETATTAGTTYHPVRFTTTATTTETTQGVIWTTWQQPPTTFVRPQYDSPALSEREKLVARNRRESRALRQRNAQRRARELLLAHLNDEQRGEWEQSSYFHVETANGRRRYRIERGHVGNVRVVLCDEPAPVKTDLIRVGTKLCAHAYHPDGWIPEEDHALAQKLLLESDGGEAEFLRMANVL